MSANVLNARLETQFLDGRVKHIRNAPSDSFFRVEEIWATDRILGEGMSGTVRLEIRQASNATLDSDLPPQVRAVKAIRKRTLSANWNYLKELETALKFSHPDYANSFVRTDGWFENVDSVFIVLEYFPHGDLRKFMKTLPAFSEGTTREITMQLLQGASYMHDSDIAHRDLKPANILVASTSPTWRVKIADFGISKQAHNGTELHTADVGTLGYMAPEMQSHQGANFTVTRYSFAVDIWAIGGIALELLLGRHPFPDSYEFVHYVQGDGLQILDLALSNTCKDFIHRLLSPNAENRLTANGASRHAWLNGNAAIINPEESLFVSQIPAVAPSQEPPAFTPASLAWSSQPLLPDYEGPELDAQVLLPCFRHLLLEATKYFVLRSDNATDIETSAAHGVCTSRKRVNKMLQKGYLAAGGRVVLFFSVKERHVVQVPTRGRQESKWNTRGVPTRR